MYKNENRNVGIASIIAVTSIVLLGITALGNNANAALLDEGPHTSAMKCNDGSLCLLVAPQVVHPVQFRGELDQDNHQICNHDSDCDQVNQQNQHGRNILAGGFNFDN
jgi:hypothetical protein